MTITPRAVVVDRVCCDHTGRNLAGAVECAHQIYPQRPPKQVKVMSCTRETVFAAPPIPAQLTRTRATPCAFSAVLIPFATDSDRRRQRVQKKAPIAAARSWPDCSFRSKIGTFKLLSANSHAVASPKPDAPPVTIAPLPVKSCTKRSPWFRFLPNVPRLFFSAFCYVSKQFYSLAKRRDAFPNCAAMRRTYHGR